MRNLKTLRDGWDEATQTDARSARQLTVEQSLSIYLSMSRDMASQLAESDETFRPDREVYLTELQSRLLSLETFFREQNGTLSEPA